MSLPKDNKESYSKANNRVNVSVNIIKQAKQQNSNCSKIFADEYIGYLRSLNQFKGRLKSI
jgi:hypothetical protein